MNKTDMIIKHITEQPDYMNSIMDITALVMVVSIVYKVPEDTVLGIICTLVKAQIVSRKEEKERLTTLNNLMDKIFGLNEEGHSNDTD